jgi:hypothetical protein
VNTNDYTKSNGSNRNHPTLLKATMTKSLINQRRLDVARPFTVERTTSDSLLWPKFQQAAPAPTLPSLADWQAIAAKVDIIAERVTERQKSAEHSKIATLREHIRTFQHKPEPPPLAKHYRDRSCDPFFELAITEAEIRRARRGA